MGVLWGLVKAVVLFFVVVVAALVVLDGTLLSNLMRKRDP
jgi:hypothetical protein